MLGRSNRIKKKAFLLLCSQGCLAGAREEMEHSLQSVNCSRANHLSEGNRKKDTTEFRVRTINNIQCSTLDKNKAAGTVLLRDHGKAQCESRAVECSVMERTTAWLSFRLAVPFTNAGRPGPSAHSVPLPQGHRG